MCLHILRESLSPPTASIWVYWCGERCVAPDADFAPEDNDFYLERYAHKADCSRCLEAYLAYRREKSTTDK